MAFHHSKLQHQHDFHGCPKPCPQQPPVTVPGPPPAILLTPSPEIHHIHLLRLAMFVMAGVVGVVMFLCTASIILRSCYSRRHNHNRSTANTPILFDVNGDSPVSDNDDDDDVVNHPIWFIRTVGLQQSVIDSITVFLYRKDEGLIDGTECSVCLGEFQQDESLRLLPKCSHAFHIPCIDTWLRSHKNCPLCRAPVVNDAGSGGDATEARVTESNVSGEGETQNQENLDGGVGAGAGTHHVGDDDDSGASASDISDKTLPNSLAQEMEEEIQPMRRSVSMDLSSASVIFHDVAESSCSSETNLGDKSKDMTIGKHGSGSGSSSSSTICKLALIGRALQKRPISMRRSLSHNRKFFLSRHCRSQSSTLPL